MKCYHSFPGEASFPENGIGTRLPAGAVSFIINSVYKFIIKNFREKINPKKVNDVR